MLLRLVPTETKIPFMAGRFIALTVSLVLMVASVVLFSVRGLNYGIDFVGGVVIEFQVQGAMETATVRAAVSGLAVEGTPGVQQISDFADAGVSTKFLVSLVRQSGGAEAQNEAANLLRRAIETDLGGEVLSTGGVSGEVSEELFRAGILAMSLAVGAVLIYIWFRFEWQCGVGAVIALVHDVVLTLGFFSLIGLEFNLSIVAAILTVIGYSLNDTVVVYDRIRENFRRYTKPSTLETLNMSLNQTLSRTLMTSITTLLALLALFIFGGSVLQGFTAAMMWGVFVGTYSSVFVASPALMLLNVTRESFLATEGGKATP